jgi:transcriptional regulator with XRE-family HTH domain
MPTRDRAVDRAGRTARADLARLGSDFRTGRVGAGLSQRQVGMHVGASASQISRVEGGLSPKVSVAMLARIGAVVGLDVRLRAYPGADPLRDAGHLRVIERLRNLLAATVTVRVEVPLPIPGDRRAWDVWLGNLTDEAGLPHNMPAEVETRLADAQGLIRRLTLKLRDASLDELLLVIADTPTNRRAVAAASTSLSAMFPLPPRRASAALAAGRYPGASSLLFI